MGAETDTTVRFWGEEADLERAIDDVNNNLINLTDVFTEQMSELSDAIRSANAPLEEVSDSAEEVSETIQAEVPSMIDRFRTLGDVIKMNVNQAFEKSVPIARNWGRAIGNAVSTAFGPIGLVLKLGETESPWRL